MKDLSITLLSIDEIKKLDFLKGILDEDPTTDLCKLLGGNDNFVTRCCELDSCYDSWRSAFWKRKTHLFQAERLYGSDTLYFRGSIMPILKLSEVEKSLNIKIEDDFIELFEFPQTVVDIRTQEYLDNSYEEGSLFASKFKYNIFTNCRLSPAYECEITRCGYDEYNKFPIFLDTKTGKKYIRKRVVFQTIVNDGEIFDAYGRVDLGNRKLNNNEFVWVEVKPIRFYVCRNFDYLISTKALTVGSMLEVRNKLASCTIKCVEKYYDEVFYLTNFYKYLKNYFIEEISNDVRYIENYSISSIDIDKFLNIDLGYYKIDKLTIVIDSDLTINNIRKIYKKCKNKVSTINISYTIPYIFLFFMFKLLCPNNIVLIFSKVNQLMEFNNEIEEKAIEEISSEEQEDIYLKEINSLIEKSKNLINNLSMDSKSKVYSKLLFLIDNYNNDLELLKDRLLNNPSNTPALILTSDDPKYLKQSLLLNLTAFIRTLTNKPYLLKLLENIEQIKLSIDNNTEINSEMDKINKIIINIISVASALDNENKLYIISNIKTILDKYQNEISLELKSLVDKEVKLVLEEIDYEKNLIKDLKNIWCVLEDKPIILLLCQIANCKRLLLDNTLNIINSSGEYGTSIQKKALEINGLLNNYNDYVSSELVRKVNFELDKYLSDTNINGNESIQKLDKYLASIIYVLTEKSEEVELVYNTKKLTL